ncbi:MAG: hypothetical protein AB7V39_19935 [Nitrospiraceae bacterium]
MLDKETIFESLDLLGIANALQENPTSGLLWIETIQGKPLVFVITPWRGMLSPIQTQHIRSLNPAGCTLMIWSDVTNEMEMVEIGVYDPSDCNPT